jgi:hypothetical protein
VGRRPRSRCGYGSASLLARPTRACGTQAQNRSALRGRPTTPHPAQSPLVLLHDAARCAPYEIIRARNVVAHAIHRIRHLIRCVAREELLQSSAIQLATRCVELLRKTVGVRENVVRNRNSRLHTASITCMVLARQRRLGNSTQGSVVRLTIFGSAVRTPDRMGASGATEGLLRVEREDLLRVQEEALPVGGGRPLVLDPLGEQRL